LEIKLPLPNFQPRQQSEESSFEEPQKGNLKDYIYRFFITTLLRCN
jgi:hypothetical protein